MAIIKIVILSILVFSFNSEAKCKNRGNVFCRFNVVEVYDGDTFFITIKKTQSIFGKRLGVRVKGVNTPEIRGGTVETKAAALRAKSFTSATLSNGRAIKLTQCVRGKYFRVVCNVIIDGASLADQLIKNNLAVIYRR